jgi:hypothetical protein
MQGYRQKRHARQTKIQRFKTQSRSMGDGRLQQKIFYFKNGSRREVFLSNCHRFAAPANRSNRGEFGPIFAHVPRQTGRRADIQLLVGHWKLNLEPFPQAVSLAGIWRLASLRLHQPDISILDLVSMGL